MKSKILLILLVLLPLSSLQGQQSPPANKWKDFDFVLGEWSWTGGGKPGQATGKSTFEPDLNGTVLVRKVHLDYPATKDRPAFAHDDLLYVYRDPGDDSPRAIFFDGEGHVIRYAVTAVDAGHSLQFVSDAAPSGTRCRMTYTRASDNSVTEKFEIAPPGKPDEFAGYVEFKATRVRK